MRSQRDCMTHSPLRMAVRTYSLERATWIETRCRPVGRPHSYDTEEPDGPDRWSWQPSAIATWCGLICQNLARPPLSTHTLAVQNRRDEMARTSSHGRSPLSNLRSGTWNWCVNGRRMGSLSHCAESEPSVGKKRRCRGHLRAEALTTVLSAHVPAALGPARAGSIAPALKEPVKGPWHRSTLDERNIPISSAAQR
jgi:hypothetical protein